MSQLEKFSGPGIHALWNPEVQCRNHKGQKSIKPPAPAKVPSQRPREEKSLIIWNTCGRQSILSTKNIDEDEIKYNELMIKIKYKWTGLGHEKCRKWQNLRKVIKFRKSILPSPRLELGIRIATTCCCRQLSYRDDKTCDICLAIVRRGKNPWKPKLELNLIGNRSWSRLVSVNGDWVWLQFVRAEHTEVLT